jgi:hypothetical protein
MSNAAADRPVTTMVPVTTMEEMPLLSEADRQAMVESLEKAEADISAGEANPHNSQTFVAEMQALRNAAKLSRPA